MTKKFFRSVACLMLVLVILTAVPFGALADVELFDTTASAYDEYTENGFKYTVNNGEATVIGHENSSGDLVIPDTLGGYPVTSIGYSAFSHCRSLTSLVIPNSVTSIGDSAFYYCSALKEVTLPDGLADIGRYEFAYCRELSSITLPSSITRIKSFAFSNCTGLKSITIPDGVTVIEDQAFFICTALTDITLPDTVKSIELGAFSGCSALTDITLPSSITVIEKSTFNNCTGLTSVTIPNGITSVGEKAFYNCTGLTNVTIPESVTSAGKDAFSNCTSLTSVNIPSSVTTIDSNAFGYYYIKKEKHKVDNFTIKAIEHSYANYYAVAHGFNFEPVGESTAWQYEYDSDKNEITLKKYSGFLKNLEIPSEFDGKPVTSIGEECFAENSRLEIVTIPDSITSIGDFAFMNCSNLQSVYLSKKLTSIGNVSFGGCYQLNGIYLYEGLKSIGAYAFACCGFKYAAIPFSVTSIGECAFFMCESATVNVPCCLKNIGSDAFLNCKKVETRHNIVSTNHKPATCTQDGLTYLNTCSDCGKVFNQQQVIPATGHSFGAWQTTKKPTYTATGAKTRTCEKCGATETKTVAKLKPTSLSKCKFDTLKSYTYTGKALKPAVTVKNGKTTLKAGTHYTVTYKNNTKIGKATVTIKGIEKNGYSGTKTLTFNIIPANVKSLKATQTTSSVKLSWGKVAGAQGYRVFKYDGKKWVKVADTKNTSYTVSKLKAGTNYKFAVKAYAKSGSTTYYSASYTQLSTATKPGTPTLKATAGAKKVSLSWNKQTGASGYVVYMSTSKNGKYNVVATVKGGTKVSYTKTRLAKGKTYYFKVRAYKTVSGKNIYGSYSAVKSVKAK